MVYRKNTTGELKCGHCISSADSSGWPRVQWYQAPLDAHCSVCGQDWLGAKAPAEKPPMVQP